MAELAPLVVGGRVRDAQALPPRDVLLVLAVDVDGEERIRRLRLSANGDGPRAHLQCGRVLSHKGPEGPFFRRLADELAGAVLTALTQVGGDRILRLAFRPEVGAPVGLLAELTGRHANLILVGGADRVLELLVPPPPPKDGGAPRLVAGEPWVAPPGRPRGADGPSLAELFPEAPDPPRAAALAPLSWRVEAALGGGVEEAEEQRSRRTLESRLKRRLARARSLVNGLEKRREAAADSERVRRDGELLKAALGQVARGMDSVEVADWFEEDAPPRRIALDPKRSPKQNLERLFGRFKKLERAGAEVERELALATERLAGLEELMGRAADPATDPDALEAEAVEAGLLDPPQAAPKRRSKPEPRRPYKVFATESGTEVRVGRSARDNDDLTFRHARGNDLWLHTAEAPGSHVVLRLERGREPEKEELLDAATLAVHFSPLRSASKADVHVARCKEVKKPRGAKPGLVTLSGGRVLRVKMDSGRLRRLLSPERAGDGRR